MRLLIECGVILILVVINGVFAMSELAVVSVRRGRLAIMAQRHRPGAPAALRLAQEPTRFLSTVQIGITLIGILAGTYGGATFAGYLDDWLIGVGTAPPLAAPLAIALVVLAITYLSLVVGELVPKRLALAHAEAIACVVAPPMAVLARLLAPAVWLLRHSTDGILRLLPFRTEAAQEVSEDEVRAMIAEGTATGVFKKAEREMIEGVLRIADRQVRSIMTPRVDVTWLDLEDPPERLRQQIATFGHSRFPVCRGSRDEIVGVLRVKDLVRCSLGELPQDLAALCRPALMIHESTAILRAIDLFREAPAHFAIVLDEYGAAEGIVTPADVLSAIAGDLPEGRGDERAEAVRRPDGSWLIDGRMEIHKVERLLGRQDMGQDTDYTTLAGFVLWRLGRLPKIADRFSWDGLELEIVDLDGLRIDKVLVSEAK